LKRNIAHDLFFQGGFESLNHHLLTEALEVNKCLSKGG
jgi:hypothetical protein